LDTHKSNGLQLQLRRLVLLCTGFACVLATLVVLLGPTARANASSSGWFCLSAWLQPYGQSGDSCGQGIEYTNHMFGIAIVAGERAGCVRGLGYYGEPQTGWQCAAAGTNNWIYFPNDGRWTRGEIRNNNSSSPSHESGWYSTY
jgi:hypothetical protein